MSNVVASQVEVHRKFGGVVPEVASRNHTLALPSLFDEALTKANLCADDVDAIAVTKGAGLIGALLVGVSAAKALAFAWDKPLIEVNHIEAHIAANYPEHPDLKPPFLALVASGGHTALIDVPDYNEFLLYGTTVDDAVGEAFDKVARLLGLGYPGGPAVDREAKSGQPRIRFYKEKKTVHADLSFSYSGLKTAVVNYVHTLRQKGEELPVADICASFTREAMDILVESALVAAHRAGRTTLVLAGGAAANSYLRDRLTQEGSRNGLTVLKPSPALCADNAAMVAARAFYSARAGRDFADLSLNAVSRLPFRRAESV